MLHGTLLHPTEQNDSISLLLHTLPGVRWERLCFDTRRRLNVSAKALVPEQSNLVVILDTNCTRYGFLEELIKRGCHLFLPEKNLLDLEEMARLVMLAEEGNTAIRVRNDLLTHLVVPATIACDNHTKLIEIHQTAPGEFAQIKELLHNNLLLINRITRTEPSRISVCSVPNGGEHPEIFNLHLSFHDGSAATVVISFLGKKREHSVCLHASTGTSHFNLRNGELLKKGFESWPSTDPLYLQLHAFVDDLTQERHKNAGLDDEMVIYRLIGKIYRKMEFNLETSNW
ncbi:MAG: hypothetical protein LWW85_11965 [Marinilabiliales bacterium]|nr:hypothetical protein [Marinilabiliales bacterium]